MNSVAKLGFVYDIEIFNKHGVLVEKDRVHNIIPIEGLNYIIGASVTGASALANWFVGLYGNSYAPISTDTMATFPAAAGEATAYSSATRVAYVPGAVAAGSVDNSAAKAEFTFTADDTIYGGFMSSGSTKGGTAGILLSAVQFPSPKVVESGGILRVTAGLGLLSV